MKYVALIDMQKAYDSVIREQIWDILKGRARSDGDVHLIGIIKRLHESSTIEVGHASFPATRGVVQGAVLSP